MDMSDLTRGTGSRGGDDGSAGDAEHWRQVVGAVGSEVAVPLTSALDRILSLVSTGRIDRSGLRALREEVERARRAGMVAQQLTRFASPALRQSVEKLALADLVNTVLQHRRRDLEARGMAIEALTSPTEVRVDPALLSTLVHGLLDWAQDLTRTRIQLAIDVKTWPPQARLTCRFGPRAPDESVPADLGPIEMDNLSWRLVEQSALTMQLGLNREFVDGCAVVTLEFPQTVGERMFEEGALLVPPVGLDGAPARPSRQLAGSHVLVVASRRELRVRVRNAIRHLGLLVDLVPSMEEAVAFCQDGLPHAVIVESILSGERLNPLRRLLEGNLPGLSFIEIGEEGDEFHVSGYDGRSMGRVGRDAIESALPHVLQAELMRGLQAY